MVRMVRDGLSVSVGLALPFDSLFRQAGEVQIEEKIRFVVFGKQIGRGFFPFFIISFFQSAENDFFLSAEWFFILMRKNGIYAIFFRIYAVWSEYLCSHAFLSCPFPLWEDSVRSRLGWLFDIPRVANSDRMKMGCFWWILLKIEKSQTIIRIVWLFSCTQTRDRTGMGCPTGVWDQRVYLFRHLGASLSIASAKVGVFFIFAKL